MLATTNKMTGMFLYLGHGSCMSQTVIFSLISGQNLLVNGYFLELHFNLQEVGEPTICLEKYP